MARLRKYSPRQSARGVELVRGGLSIAASARAVRMSTPALRTHLATAGVVARQSHVSGRRTAFAPGARAFTPEEDAFIVAQRGFGWSFNRIGAEIGRAHTSVRSRFVTLRLQNIREGGR